MTKRLLAVAISMTVLLVATGCENHMQRKRDEARTRWADSRAEMLTRLAQGAFDRGEIGRARECVDEALTGAPKYAPLYVLAARIAFERGEIDTAASYASSAIAIDPQLAEAYYVQGTLEQFLGHLEQSRTAFAEAARLDPKSESYVLAEAELLVACKQTDRAAECLADAVERMPGRAAVQLAYGDVLCLLGRYGEAVGAYHIAQRLDPKRDDLTDRLALALFGAGDYAEAESLLATLAESKSGAGFEWIGLKRIECLLALGRAADARALATSLLKRQPDAVALLVARAKCDVVDHRFDGARDDLEKVLSAQPSNAEANAIMGYLLIESDHPGEAVSHLKLALRDPTLPRRETVERLLDQASVLQRNVQ